MHLHENRKLFADAVLASAQYLDIDPIFVEKDYWISRSLKLMAQADCNRRAIFKGGTSLSKAHFIGSRFSEDIDIAIADADTLSGNQRKNLIKRLAKSATSGLIEIPTPGVTSKGSSYYKAIYGYERIQELSEIEEDLSIRPGQIMMEINSFANPFPFLNCSIGNFICDFLKKTGNQEIISEYSLEEFNMDVLDKKRTATEKIVSLLRFSLAPDYVIELPKKIRHFYDLYYLMEDEECMEYFNSDDFFNDLNALLSHDRAVFDHPEGWNRKSLSDSPLWNSLEKTWNSQLSDIYQKELSKLAYKPIPASTDILDNINAIMSRIKSLGAL